MIGLRVLLGLLGFLAAESAVPSQARAERYCEIVRCERQCFPTAGGMHCVRRCLRRCWNSAPPPAPRPQYVAPQDSHADAVAADPAAGALFLCVVAVVFLAVLAALSDDSSIDGIAKAQQSAADARLLARDAHTKTHAIDAFVADAESDAFQRGRAAADKEWTRE